MTELEFISTNPANYGVGNANLLYSSSVTGPDNIPVPPYLIQGLAIPFTTKDGVSVIAALKEVTKFKFTFVDSIVTATVREKKQQSGFYYYRLNPFFSQQLPESIDESGNTFEEDSLFTFIPYVAENFINSDYNPLINNSQGSILNSTRQVVDRTSDQAIPTNLAAILAGGAKPAEIQDSTYTAAGLANGRFKGTKLTSGSVPGNDPALGLKSFKGLVFEIDADNTIIADSSAGESVEYYFNLRDSISRTGQLYRHNNTYTGSIPQLPSGNLPGSLIFEEQGNSFVRMVNKKIFAVESGFIYKTNEFGNVISRS